MSNTKTTTKAGWFVADRVRGAEFAHAVGLTKEDLAVGAAAIALDQRTPRWRRHVDPRSMRMRPDGTVRPVLLNRPRRLSVGERVREAEAIAAQFRADQIRRLTRSAR